MASSRPLALLLLLLAVGSSNAKDRPAKLDRDKLLFYTDGAGKVQPVKTIADWEKRRASIHEAMHTIMGPLPGKDKRCPLDVKVVEEVDCGIYVRRLISYQSEPGMRTPAYLLIPKSVIKGDEKVPAVLSLHPTNAKGFRVTVGLADTMNREYGVELAERGYVVIATPYPQLSDYTPDLKKLGYQSGTMKAIWDNMRAMDVLDTLPYVKKGHYAAIGHSLGGHNSIYTAAFDPRIKVAVSCCGLDSYRDYMGGKIKGWTSDRYMPKLLDYEKKLDQVPFDFGEILATIAPRHVLVIAPKEDDNFRWQSAAKVVTSASAVFRLYREKIDEVNIQIEHPDCKHVFSPEMRAKAYQLMDKVLKAPDANSLSDKEQIDGWVLLYDGKTTKGWKIDGDAASKDGVLRVGGKKPARIDTTEKFTNIKLAYEFRWQGKTLPSANYPLVGKRPFLLSDMKNNLLEAQQDLLDASDKWSYVEIAFKRGANKQKPEVLLGCELENARGWSKTFLHYKDGVLAGDIVYSVEYKSGASVGGTKVDLKINLNDLLPQAVETPLGFEVPADTILELRNVKILPVKPAANTLSEKERADGWALLYDGKSTDGWKIEGEAVSKDGVLKLGGTKAARLATTADFANPDVSFEFRYTGKKLPDVTFPRAGKTTFLPLSGDLPGEKIAIVGNTTEKLLPPGIGWNQVSMLFERNDKVELKDIRMHMKYQLQTKTGSWKCFFHFENSKLTGHTVYKYETKDASAFAFMDLDFKIEVFKVIPKDLKNGPLVFEVPAGTVMELRNVKIRPAPAEKN